MEQKLIDPEKTKGAIKFMKLVSRFTQDRGGRVKVVTG